MFTPLSFMLWPLSEKPVVALNSRCGIPNGAMYVSTTAPPTFTSVFTW